MELVSRYCYSYGISLIDELTIKLMIGAIESKQRIHKRPNTLRQCVSTVLESIAS